MNCETQWILRALRAGHSNATDDLGPLLCEYWSKEGRPDGGQVGPECKMLEGFGSVPGAELRDKNRPHLGKPGMKLNSRALASSASGLPTSRNALTMVMELGREESS